MTSSLDSQRRSQGDRAKARAYNREFWPGMVAYALVLGAVLIWGGLDGHSPWRFVWALAPVLPAAWTVHVVLRHVRRVDEYQKLLLLQSLAVGFAVAMLAAITLGFLAIAGLRLADAPDDATATCRVPDALALPRMGGSITIADWAAALSGR
jgi:hypothetical protein